MRIVKNVGITDRILRFLFGIAITIVGLFWMDGIDGELLGMLVSICSLLPIYMSLTGKCFVFSWLNIHSFSKKECNLYGIKRK